MKKFKLSTIIYILMCLGCDKNNRYTIIKDEFLNEYIQTIPSSSIPFIERLRENKILLTNAEIDIYNNKIRKKTNTIYDINSINQLSKEEILNYINFYNIPNLPKYNNGTEITQAQVSDILDNRNIENIDSNKILLKGIIVNRTNLKSFPTDIHFYENKHINNFDNLQESELHVNTPVLVIHESKDKEWYFVLSTTYAGWVKALDVGFAKDIDYNFFINNNFFGIVTAPILKTQNIILDMSVKLPISEIKKKEYKLFIPIKNKDGYIERKEIVISKDNIHIGYIPYTKRNIYIQAFKYENINYSWGGMDYGVDCSSYISNLYRTFGFVFPRNTESQNSSIGEIIDLSNKSIPEKLNILSHNYPAILYEQGHVMLYLGIINNKHYIIHASGAKNEMKVIVTELNKDSYHIANINKLVLIR